MTVFGTKTGSRLSRRFSSRRFRQGDDGSVAVETGLVAIPFLALLFAMIETAMIFFASVSMEGAMEDAARLIRTGIAQGGSMSAVEFKQRICERSVMFVDCNSNLSVDVRTFDAFTNVTFDDPIDANGNLNMNFQYDPGQAGDIVLVRAFYVWDVITPVGIGLENMSGGNRLLSSSAVFRNEPFGELLGG